MKLDFTTIDAFTTTRYNGNPVAIVRVPALEKQSESSTQSTGTAMTHIKQSSHKNKSKRLLLSSICQR